MAELSEPEIAVNQRFVEIYNKLKALYIVEGKSEFCAVLGMPKANFSRYEKNLRSIPGQYLDELEGKFGVSKEYLLHGEGPMLKSDQKSSQSVTVGRIKGNQNNTGFGSQANFAPPTMDLNLVTALEKEIEGLKRLIAEKDERIQELKETIAHLRKS